MKIIGLTGAAGSGKDTAAKIALEWCEKRGVVGERLALADPLKVSAARALGFGGDTAQCVAFCNALKRDGTKIAIFPTPGPAILPEGEQYELSGRQFLQWYGTEAHRDVFGKDFWTEVAHRRLDECGHLGVDVVFITDVRFPNEQDMVYARGGTIWRVDRTNVRQVEAHASEAGLTLHETDCIIKNDGSLDDLRSVVSSLCEENLEGVE